MVRDQRVILTFAFQNQSAYPSVVLIAVHLLVLCLIFYLIVYVYFDNIGIRKMRRANKSTSRFEPSHERWRRPKE